MPAAFQPVYCASKHGVIGFTRSIAVSMHFPKGCQQLLGNLSSSCSSSTATQLELILWKKTNCVKQWRFPPFTKGIQGWNKYCICVFMTDLGFGEHVRKMLQSNLRTVGGVQKPNSNPSFKNIFSEPCPSHLTFWFPNF